VIKILVFKEGECRKKKANIHNPNGSKFCPNCNHYALVDNTNKCECCQLHIVNKKKFTELKTFEKIIKAHRQSIQEWIAFPSNPDLDYGWPIRIGIINYFVSVRYFAEYLELPELEGDDIQKKFLDNVKKESAVLGRYMHSIK